MVDNNPEGQVKQPSVEPAAPPRSAPSGPDPFEQMAKAMAEEFKAHEETRKNQMAAARDRGDDTKELEVAHARSRDLEKKLAEQTLENYDIGARLYQYVMDEALKTAAGEYGVETEELRKLALKSAKTPDDIDRIAFKLSRQADRKASLKAKEPEEEEEEEPVYETALPSRGGPNLKDMTASERLHYELEQLHRRRR